MLNKPTVALCLIVQNEEELIFPCLNSVKGIVDDYIVVDTGSSDETVKLAVAAGANVFHFPWTSDFAAARNFALTQAVSDWVLVLDADETLEPVNPEAFLQLLCEPSIEGYFVRIKNLIGAGSEETWDEAVRLFRNKAAYRFSGSIHEQVALSILNLNGGQGLAHAPLTILHGGYLDERLARKHKFQRNTQILKHALSESPHDPFLLYCLALEYYQHHEVSEGLVCLEKAVPRLQGQEGYFGHALYCLAWGLLYQGRIERLIDFTAESLQMLPRHTGLLLLRGIGYLYSGQYQQASAEICQLLESRDTWAVSQAEAPIRASLAAYLSLIGAELAVTGQLMAKEFNPKFLPLAKRVNELLGNLLMLT